MPKDSAGSGQATYRRREEQRRIGDRPHYDGITRGTVIEYDDWQWAVVTEIDEDYNPAKVGFVLLDELDDSIIEDLERAWGCAEHYDAVSVFRSGEHEYWTDIDYVVEDDIWSVRGPVHPDERDDEPELVADGGTLHKTTTAANPSIIPLEDQHVERAHHLWETRFGAPEDHAAEWLADARLDADSTAQGFVASVGGYVVGFGIAAACSQEYIQNYLDPASVETWDTTGLLHILVVDKAYEGRGIGSQLVEARLRWLSAVTEADGVVGVSWHRDDYRDSRVLFEKYGFEPAQTIEEYYAKLDGETPCPDCEGEGECYCDATVYRRPLPQNGGEVDV